MASKEIDVRRFSLLSPPSFLFFFFFFRPACSKKARQWRRIGSNADVSVLFPFSSSLLSPFLVYSGPTRRAARELSAVLGDRPG